MDVPNVTQHYLYCGSESVLDKRRYDNDRGYAQQVARSKEAMNPFSNTPNSPLPVIALFTPLPTQQGLPTNLPIPLILVPLLRNPLSETLLQNLKQLLQQLNQQQLIRQAILLGPLFQKAETFMAQLIQTVFWGQKTESAQKEEKEQFNDIFETDPSHNLLGIQEIKAPEGATALDHRG